MMINDMELELKKRVWLSRSLRCAAEQQKFHLMACAVLALGDKAACAKLKEKSFKFGQAIEKCMKKAVECGFRKEDDLSEADDA